MGFDDRRSYQEGLRGHSVVYRLSTGKLSNKAYGIDNAIDQ